jgi:anti-anti-sigma factor
MVFLFGEIDMLAELQLESMLEEAERDAGPRGNVVVDLGAASFCDVRGFGRLLDSSRRSRAAGTTFVLRRPCRSLRVIIDATGTSDDLIVEEGWRLAIAEQHDPR